MTSPPSAARPPATAPASATSKTERDLLAQRLERLQRAEAERQATAHGMATAPDLWLLVPELGELLADGELDPDRVRDRVEAILRERPSWRRSTPVTGGSRGVGGNGRPLGLSDLISQRRRGR